MSQAAFQNKHNLSQDIHVMQFHPGIMLHEPNHPTNKLQDVEVNSSCLFE